MYLASSPDVLTAIHFTKFVAKSLSLQEAPNYKTRKSITTRSKCVSRNFNELTPRPITPLDKSFRKLIKSQLVPPKVSLISPIEPNLDPTLSYNNSLHPHTAL
jgi:hypothetical protein